jgi:site-specific DNA-methyltransferase (adenine-specific)
MKKQFKLMQGDNMASLKQLPDNSIDSVVTDPPYGLNFMGKKWDYDVPSVEFWTEVYRVLKPGGHILSFGGTRTYHRMVVNIEDAGFEIRDQIMWIYGSGFPKSHNIGKAVDKIEGNKREVVGKSPNERLNKTDCDSFDCNGLKKELDITKGNSAYEGYGTNLKPAVEPICVARKPLSEKTVAANMMKWGTGGINVDGCRIEGAYGDGENKVVEGKEAVMMDKYDETRKSGAGMKQKIQVSNSEGRFPANIIFDEEAAQLLDEQSGVSKSSKSNKQYNNDANGRVVKNSPGGQRSPESTYSDKGGASRFFYVAKVSKKERNLGVPEDMKSTHPTMKPINLMTYLIRLVTPENGIVLEPFMGSGSTGIAAMLEGRRFVGMEMDADYFKIAEKRIESWEQYKKLIK